ncbi:MAG: hypothetical protein RLZZ546_2689 [Bacteroidota bacterium]
MFSGIIESFSEVINVEKEGSNIHFTMTNPFQDEKIYIDQSIAHNGCCLTIVEIDPKHTWYKVTAIKETLDKTNLGSWKEGTRVNVERCIKADSRIDGHFVQGHVDITSTCTEVKTEEGSWYFTFELPDAYNHLIVDKGSIAINGTSLTAILDENHENIFKVAIIPYTYEHTNFHQLKSGMKVNLEFDILGKYIAKMNNFRR